MMITVLVERYYDYWEVMLFLDRVAGEYTGRITEWEEEISLNEEGFYRVAIKVKSG